MAELRIRDLRVITIMLGIMVVFVLGVVLHELSSVLLPFVIALLLAFVFKPVVLWLRARKVPMVLALLIVVVLVGAVLALVSMLIYSSVESFIANLPAYQARLAKLNDRLADLIRWGAERVGADPAKFNIANIINWSVVTSVATASLSTFVNLL